MYWLIPQALGKELLLEEGNNLKDKLRQWLDTIKGIEICTVSYLSLCEKSWGNRVKFLWKVTVIQTPNQSGYLQE